MEKQRLNKWLYWMSPLIGVACNIIVLIGFSIMDSIFSYGSGGWGGGFGPSMSVVVVMLNVISIPLVMLLSYLYLIMLNKYPRYYGLFTSIIAICYVCFPFWLYVDIFKSEEGMLVFPLLGISHFVPLCWVAYLYKAEKRPDTTID